MNVWAWLLSIAGPLATRVLVALGVGVVTYGGLTLVATQIKDKVILQLSGLTGDAYQVIAMTGAFEAVGILLGGLAARAALMAVAKFTKLAAPTP